MFRLKMDALVSRADKYEISFASLFRSRLGHVGAIACSFLFFHYNIISIHFNFILLHIWIMLFLWLSLCFVELLISVVQIENLCCFILKFIFIFMTYLEYASFLYFAKPVRLHIIDTYLLPSPSNELGTIFVNCVYSF